MAGNNTKFLVFLALVAGVVFVAQGGKLTTGPAPGSAVAAAPPDNCGGGASMAFVMSQKFVRNRLKAPSTAQFPHSSSTREIGKCRYEVTAYVDAQNAFGAMLRTRYSAVMQYNGDRMWSASDIVLDD